MKTMFLHNKISIYKRALFCAILALQFSVKAAPFTIKAGLFDQSKTEDLGLSTPTGTETFMIYKPTATSDHYSNAVVMTAFKGFLYCQWQSSATNEDSQDTWLAYSRSADGKTWTAPMHITTSSTTEISTSGGWWVNGDTLVAYINVWPNGLSPEGGNAYYKTSLDGITWSAMQPVKMKNGADMTGVFEQDPHALPDGRIINAVHFQSGLQVCPVYTDDKSGVRGWVKASFAPSTASTASSNEMEPSWFRRSDGAAVMIFRDQSSSFYKFASVSTDSGNSWTTPVKTDMPDSRSKQSAGNLPDGQAFMVNNPVLDKVRIPLVITLSDNGSYFDKAYVLRKGGSDLQAQIYTGTAKGLGYSYPKSMVYNDYIYVAYSVNKEDVQYTRVPIAAIYPPKKGQNYVYESSAPDLWTTASKWTSATVPSAATDTAIIRTGEVKVSADVASVVKVETNGIFRLSANIAATDLRLQGGTLKSHTSTPLFTLTSGITAEKASTIWAGSVAASVFEIKGTIKGAGNLTKTNVGVLNISVDASAFNGNWIVADGVLRVSSANALGSFGVTVEMASLDIDVAATTASLVLKKGANLNLDANLTVQTAVFEGVAIPAGTYSSADYPAFVSGTAKLIVMNCPSCVTTQTITLIKGWNLISIHLMPDTTVMDVCRAPRPCISTIFAGLDVLEIKDMNSFWRKDQADMCNGLQTITPGEGYLVNMNAAGTLTITGTPVQTRFIASLQSSNWSLIGCSYQTATPFSQDFNATNCSVIKDFSGFWIPSGTTNSIQNFEIGKAYFLKK